MSFVSFKRQLSADLERISSRNHGNKTTAYPKSASAFRKLGSTAQNRTKPVRGIKQDARNRNQMRECVPVPPPPSRRELFPPFLDDTKQCNWMDEDDELLRQNIAENCSKHSPSVAKLCLPDWQSALVDKSSKYPPINLRRSRGFIPSQQNVFEGERSCRLGQNAARVFLPGRTKVPTFSCSKSSTLLGKNSGGILDSGRPTTRYQISDRRKEPTIRLVVNLPKPERVKPFVMFSYKHKHDKI